MKSKCDKLLTAAGIEQKMNAIHTLEPVCTPSTRLQDQAEHPAAQSR